LNETELGTCRGSFALSPASFLTLPFGDSARKLIHYKYRLPVYCLFGLRDDASVENCSDVLGLTVIDYGYIENHGMELFQPDVPPNPLTLLDEFLLAALSGGER
jgi:hypothetical protein